MKLTLTLARKELSMMMNAPATYVIGVIFLLINGWLFASPLFMANQSSLDTFVRPLPLIFTFLVPALTMRAFSEEFKTGTIEYLATLPLEDHQIVIAKFLAALGLIGVLVGFTLCFPVLLYVVGRPDPGQLFGTYVSIFGLASFFTAIGLWASAFTKNQVVAFIISFFVCFLFYLLGRIADFLPGMLASFVRGFSVENHFDPLARGVLDSRDLVYWASGTVFFLMASLAVVQSKQWRTNTVGLVMAAVIVLLVNVLGNWVFFRTDLTQNQAYSLSDSSKKLVRALEDPVVVKAYFTPDLPPPYNAYERYVRDLLVEYRSASHGKVRFEFALQSPPEEFEKKAADAGLMPIQFEQMGSDQLQIRRGYMGLVLFHRDKSETLPIVRDVQQLEYDITSRIAKMAARSKKVIAVASGHGETRWLGGDLKVAADLSQLYDFKEWALPAGATSQLQADAILVVGPKQKWDEKSLGALDQAIRRGIPVGFFLDIKNLVLNRFYVMPLDSGLGDLLKNYGILLGDRLVYDLQCETIGLTQNMAGFAFTASMRYPYIPQIDRVMNTNPIGRGIDTIGVPFTTTVEAVPGLPAGNHFTTLLYTSPKSWLAKAQPYASVAPNDIPRPTANDPHGPYSVAGLMEGKSTIVVLGTSKVLDPTIPAFPGQDAWVSNLLAYLAKDETLLGIRSKGEIVRPLRSVSHAGQEAVKVIATLGAAALPIALGLWRWRRREQWRAHLRATFAPKPITA